ncbi:uncharacterized protein LOC116519995 [Thamnophis elegans]|uniref:uncharacterized protein LOC116519995 n=1 Tax=Thamnophis elegans TaxID=35005 RepID=UPI0013768429|nr:uncharacterized protein LOC116519995 [Thamnophis elegans]
MEPPEEPVNGEKLDVAAPKPGVAKGSPSKPKPAPTRASPRTRAKAPLAKKAAQIPPKAVDPVDAAGGKEQERPLVDGAAACSASQPLQPVTEAGETPSPSCPPDGAREELSQPQLPVMEPAQPSSLPPASTPLPPESPSEEPAAKRAKPSTPEAAVPPAAAGKKAQKPEMTPQMRRMISEAIAQGIAAGIQQQLPASSAASDNALPQGQAPPPPSMNIPESLSQDLPQSEDKGETRYGNGFVGLFTPALFKTLLQKAKAAAGIGGDPADLNPASSNPNNLLFSQPNTEKEEIPCPKFFLDVVQRQWIQPGTSKSPCGYDKQLYNVASDFVAALEMPTVDEPISRDVTGLGPEDKRVEQMLSRGHSIAGWGIRSAMAASFFNRTSLLWLKQMQARIPATDLQTHEDINNLIAAAEYSADATLNAVKFASRAIGFSVTARRMVWLRYLPSEAKYKWKLASSPFKGDKLFGEALEAFLAGIKDLKKARASRAKNPNKRNFQTASLRGGRKAHNSSQAHRAYFQRPDNHQRPDNQFDWAEYGYWSGQQFQSKQPIRGNGRGNGSRFFPRSSRGLPRQPFQFQPFREPAATGDWSPQGFEEVESYCPPKKKQQASGVQEIQNPVHTEGDPGGQHPDVNKSHRSIPTHSYVGDSPTISMDMQREAALPVQSPHKDTSDTLSSPQDYPYSRPTVSGRHVDRIRLSPPRRSGSTHDDPGPSGSFRESGIHRQQRQESLASYQQDAPPSRIYRDDMHSLPVPGQHRRSGEPDPVGPNGASRPRLTIVKKDGVVRLHCSRGTSGQQDVTMAPRAYSETGQEQFNYRRPSPIRGPPVADATDRNQQIQGNEPIRDRYGRQYAQLENPDRDPDGRWSVDRRGMTNQRQPGRDPSRPRSPPTGPNQHLQPSRPDPSRERRHQGPYEPPREHPLQMQAGRRRQRTEPS